MIPFITSEWPPRYLVLACSEMSAPWANAGHPSGVAQVLSISTSAPRACAAAAIAGTSWTSNESDPGDSTNTTLVAGRISRSMPPPINGS